MGKAHKKLQNEAINAQSRNYKVAGDIKEEAGVEWGGVGCSIEEA